MLGRKKEGKNNSRNTCSKWQSYLRSRPRLPWQDYPGKHVLTGIYSLMFREHRFFWWYIWLLKATKLNVYFSFCKISNFMAKIYICCWQIVSVIKRDHMSKTREEMKEKRNFIIQTKYFIQLEKPIFSMKTLLKTSFIITADMLKLIMY